MPQKFTALSKNQSLKKQIKQRLLGRLQTWGSFLESQKGWFWLSPPPTPFYQCFYEREVWRVFYTTVFTGFQPSFICKENGRKRRKRIIDMLPAEFTVIFFLHWAAVAETTADLVNLCKSPSHSDNFHSCFNWWFLLYCLKGPASFPPCKNNTNSLQNSHEMLIFRKKWKQLHWIINCYSYQTPFFLSFRGCGQDTVHI